MVINIIKGVESKLRSYYNSSRVKGSGSRKSDISAVRSKRKMSKSCERLQVDLPAQPHSIDELNASDSSVHTAEVQCGKGNKTSHICHVCGKVYVDEACLNEHLSTHLGEKKVHCMICDETCDNEDKLKLHIETHFSQLNSLRERKIEPRTDSGGVMSKSKCRQSSVATRSSDKQGATQSVVVETQLEHSESSTKMITEGESSESVPEWSHENDVPQGTSTPTRHHPNEIFWTKADLVCEQCGKQFDTRKKWREHKRCHITDKPFLCSICGKSFLFFAFYKAHLTAHSNVRPFTCPHCGQSFKSKDHMNTHIKIQHTDHQSFLCHICGRSFKLKFSLQSHLKVHSGERPHQCEHCPMAFIKKSTLKYHLLLHTDEKPYKCDMCSSEFRLSAGLKFHKRTHTGEKPFKCSMCDRAFARLGTLRDHKKTHTGEKPHQCDVCWKYFAQKSALNTHKKIHLRENDEAANAAPVLN